MNLNTFLAAKICSRQGCSALQPASAAVCSYCSGKELKPFYNYEKMFSLQAGWGEKELASAYKKLSLKYHPDINSSGNEVFLVLSEGYQTLKDSRSKNVWESLMEQARSGNWTQKVQPVFGNDYGPFAAGGVFTSEDFERIFREFHRFSSVNVKEWRRRQLSGRAALMLGLIAGIYFFDGFLALIPAFFLMLYGRSKPHLAMWLIRLLDLTSIAGGGYLVWGYWTAGKPGLALFVLLSVLFYNSLSSRWKKELKTN